MHVYVDVYIHMYISTHTHIHIHIHIHIYTYRMTTPQLKRAQGLQGRAQEEDWERHLRALETLIQHARRRRLDLQV